MDAVLVTIFDGGQAIRQKHDGMVQAWVAQKTLNVKF